VGTASQLPADDHSFSGYLYCLGWPINFAQPKT
jgi:hypothetical protein